MPKPATKRPGRPTLGDVPMTRHQVYLDAATLEKAALLGGGNVSAGIRIAFQRLRTYPQAARKYTK